MISKYELLEQLHEQGIIMNHMDKRVAELNHIIAQKDAIIDAIVFKNYEKFNDARDFNTYDEFMSSIFDQPIKTAIN